MNTIIRSLKEVVDTNCKGAEVGVCHMPVSVHREIDFNLAVYLFTPQNPCPTQLHYTHKWTYWRHASGLKIQTICPGCMEFV
jgi:hypothetical protein